MQSFSRFNYIRKGSLALVFVFMFTSVVTQNYQVINPNRTYLYEESEPSGFENNKYLRAINIDSISTSAQDTIYFNFNTIGYYDEEPYMSSCYNTFGTSWLGTRVINKPNGDTWFFNSYYEDSTWKHRVLNLKTKAQINESWIFYNSNTYTISGEVVSIDTLHFLGLYDTIKEIELTVSSKKFTDYYGSIFLSKNHGMIKTIIFRDVNPDQSLVPVTLDLIGVNNPKIGYQPITWGDINDYEIGDEFHKRIYYYQFPSTSVNFYETNRVIDKITYSDTNKITYIFETYHWGWPGPGTYVFEHDTISKTYTGINSLARNVYPFEVDIIDPDWMIGYNTWYYNSGQFNSRKIIKNPVDTYNYFGDSCYYLNTGVSKDSKSLGHTLFIVGCGSYQMATGYLNLPCYPCNYLQYFKKGTEEWGTPLSPPVNMSEVEHEKNNIIIYPNPATERLNIKSDRKWDSPEIKIFNAMGEIQKHVIYGKTDHIITINISSYTKGVNFLSVQDRGVIFREKFVVQ